MKQYVKFKQGHNARGLDHYKWNGGRKKHGDGYWMIRKPDHHFADTQGYVMEHRLVWEEFYEVSLLPWAAVHHKNGKRDDNRIENLQAMMHGAHTTLTNTKDKSRRVCLQCNSKNTYIASSGWTHWFCYQDGFICHKCYKRRRNREKEV